MVRMLDSSARRPSSRRPRAVPAAVRVAVGTLVLALALSGCTDEQQVASPPAPTPIAELDAASLKLPRIEFCSLLPRSAPTRALGGKPDAETAYGNGDEVELPGVGTDVGHEIGCTWSTESGSAARAWVFARPVDAQLARTVIASGRRTPGCRTVPGPAFGEPSATQRCTLPGGVHRVRHSGLFERTWLTCELAAPGTERAGLRARTDRWCVEVANALDATR